MFGFFGWIPHFTIDQVPDLSGKVALVTGANGGLGSQTARELALNGAKVYLGVRRKEKGLELKSAIEETLSDEKQVRYKGGSVHVLENSNLDLGDMNSIPKWVQDFQSQEDRLDILVCSAAILPPQFTLATSPAYEQIYTTSHLGHFFLCSELLPLLQSTPGESRIVVVSSDVSYHMDSWNLHKGVDWCISLDRINDVKEWSRSLAYSRSKICNVLFTRHLASLLDPASVKVNAVHPGVFASDIIWTSSHSRRPEEQMGWVEYYGRKFITVLASVIAMGKDKMALTTLFAAASREISEKGYHGEFFYPYGILKTHELVAMAKDDEVAKTLWDRSILQVKEGLKEGSNKQLVFETLATNTSQ
ncbi:unnamed protein product [Sympodiomycopsis kandeliae]